MHHQELCASQQQQAASQQHQRSSCSNPTHGKAWRSSGTTGTACVLRGGMHKQRFLYSVPHHSATVPDVPLALLAMALFAIVG